MKRHLNRCRFDHGLSRKKAIQKSPQAFLDCKYKNKISAEYSQSERVGYSKSSNYLCYTLSLTSWKPALVSSVRICSI